MLLGIVKPKLQASLESFKRIPLDVADEGSFNKHW